MDEILLQILASLRQCEAQDSTKVNKKFIRIDYRNCGVRLDVSGIAIKSAIEDCISDNFDGYFDKKRKQRQALGFLVQPYAGSFVIEAIDQNDVADLFLGKKTSRFTNLSLAETRFGITLPMALGSDSGELSLTPRSRPGKAVFRSNGEISYVKIDVTIRVTPPGLNGSNDYMKAVIENNFFEITIVRSHKRILMNFTALNEKSIFLSEHVILNKILNIAASGSGKMELYEGRNRFFEAPFVLSDPDLKGREDGFGRIILQMIRSIVDAAGANDLLVSAQEINQQHDLIEFVYKTLSFDNALCLGVSTNDCYQKIPKDIESTEILVIGRIEFSGQTLAFCAIGICNFSFEDSTVKLQIDALRAREFELIDGSVESFRLFRIMMEDETAVRIVAEIGMRNDD